MSDDVTWCHCARGRHVYEPGEWCPPDGPVEATHVPCCSAHGEPMTCEEYRRTHFVEVRPCCAIDAARLRGES